MLKEGSNRWPPDERQWCGLNTTTTVTVFLVGGETTDNNREGR